MQNFVMNEQDSPSIQAGELVHRGVIWGEGIDETVLASFEAGERLTVLRQTVDERALDWEPTFFYSSALDAKSLLLTATGSQIQSILEIKGGATIRRRLGYGTLILWGTLERRPGAGHDGTVLFQFRVTLWHIFPEEIATRHELERLLAEKDRVIRKLTLEVALSHCQQ